VAGEGNFVPFISLSGGHSLPAEPAAKGGAVVEQFDIGCIKLKAFYDAAKRLLFVLDMTEDEVLPNTVLVLDEKGDRKWDDILENDFSVPAETIRPRKDNKYQKLDIDYEGLDYYNDAIFTKNAEQLKEWRRRSAETQKEIRIREARHELDLARATVGEARKTIADLDEFMELQREKLKAAKSEIGKVSPKDSAAKILRYEARIERADAKKARSLRRLKRAQKRIDSSAKMLNNYGNDLTASDSEKAFPKASVKRLDIGGENMNENDVKPLFTEDPNIMDTENAFRPVSFDRPMQPSVGAAPQPQYAPPPPPQYSPEPQYEQPAQYAPQPQYTPPPQHAQQYTAPQQFAQPAAPQPMMERPVAPVSGRDIKIQSTEGLGNRASGAYYLLLLLLIGLSIFTLYLYQEKMNSAEIPHIAATTPARLEPLPERLPERLPELVEPVFHAEPAAPSPFIEPFPAAQPDSPFFDPIIAEEFLPEPQSVEFYEEGVVEDDYYWPASEPVFEPAPVFEPEPFVEAVHPLIDLGPEDLFFEDDMVWESEPSDEPMFFDEPEPFDFEWNDEGEFDVDSFF